MKNDYFYLHNHPIPFAKLENFLLNFLFYPDLNSLIHSYRI